MKKIGVLGDVRPEAAILFQQLLLNAMRTQDDKENIASLINMNPQVTLRLAYVLDQRISASDPCSVLKHMVKRSDTTGAVALAMQCNTAHLFAEANQKKIALAFFNLVNLSLETTLTKSKSDDVMGFLIWQEDAAKMMQIIDRIKTSGHTAGAYCILFEACSELTRRRANLQLMACSDFSMLQTSHDRSEGMIDNFNVLAGPVKQLALKTRAPQHGVRHVQYQDFESRRHAQ